MSKKKIMVKTKRNSGAWQPSSAPPAPPPGGSSASTVSSQLEHLLKTPPPQDTEAAEPGEDDDGEDFDAALHQRDWANKNLDALKADERICRLGERARSALRILDLSSNKLEDVPVNLSLLDRLEYLYLSNNQLTALYSCSMVSTTLEYLYLSQNDCLRSLPNDVSRLGMLEDLFLKGNASMRSLPVSLKRMGNLEMLDLSESPGIAHSCQRASGRGSAKVGQLLVELEEAGHLQVQAETNGSSSAEADYLRRQRQQREDLQDCQQLTRDWYNMRLDSAGAAQRASAMSEDARQATTTLDVSYNRITQCRFVATHFPNLTSLYLVSNPLERNVLRWSSWIPRTLTYLSVSSCNLEVIPNDIAVFASLQTLILVGNLFSSLPVALKKLTALQLLDLSHNQQLPPPCRICSRSPSELLALLEQQGALRVQPEPEPDVVEPAKAQPQAQPEHADTRAARAVSSGRKGSLSEMRKIIGGRGGGGGGGRGRGGDLKFMTLQKDKGVGRAKAAPEGHACKYCAGRKGDGLKNVQGLRNCPFCGRSL